MLSAQRNTLSVLIALDMIIFFSNGANDDNYVTIYEPLPGEIPFLISLMSKLEEEFYCIGVLITRWHSMTSCSCLTSPTQASRQSRLNLDDLIIVAGITTLRNAKRKGVTRKVKLLIVHPGCEKYGNFIKYDLGIAISETPFDLGKFVHTAKLPFRVESDKPYRFKQMLFANYSVHHRTQLATSLISWSGENEDNQKLKIVRLVVLNSIESGYFRIHKDQRDKDQTQYTLVSFKSPFCPNFDEAALFSDGQVFFGVVTGLKSRLCNHSEILFTRADYVLEWIVHVISKGNIALIQRITLDTVGDFSSLQSRDGEVQFGLYPSFWYTYPRWLGLPGEFRPSSIYIAEFK
ncbi:uncharacterized protein LOC106668959 [Cimex lectularius]|uniref:Peptidase S1 domain-containing protein n=1 Tax=Cimex lectularius TaxID=79782 RepID=A0A8I6S0L6_CIMLE|nr:uncharacterized protein LOC106668959 [Cimex lectularius]